MPKRKRSSFSSSLKRYARKKSRGSGRKIYKAKRKRVSRIKRRMYKTPNAIANPRWYTPSAPRVRTRHRQVMSLQDVIGDASGRLWRSAGNTLHPLKLRDIDATLQNQPFPEKFIELAHLYSRYRVYGLRIKLTYLDLPSNQNQHWWSVAYYTSAKDGVGDPFASISTRASRDSFLQRPYARRKFIVGNGITNIGARNNVHDLGYFKIANIEQIRRMDMDDEEYSGSVTNTGTAVSDPVRLPHIWLAIINPLYDPLDPGFLDLQNFNIRCEVSFDCEWFDRRDTLTPTNDEES